MDALPEMDAPDPRRWLWRLEALAGVLLLSVLRCGAVTGFDLHQIDEEVLVLHALQFFTGDLNPHWFNYHTLPMYLLGAVYAVMYGLLLAIGWVDSPEGFAALLFADEAWFYVSGKLLMSFLYTAGCALLAWVLWRRWRAPWAAGAFFAATFLLPDALIASNQIKVEAAVFAFMCGLLWFGFLAPRNGRNLIIAVVFLAAAVDSKIPALTLIPVLAAQAVGDLWLKRYSWRWVAGAAGVFAVALFLFMPYAFLDFGEYRNTIERTAERATGELEQLGKEYHAGFAEKAGAVVVTLAQGGGPVPLVACVALAGVAVWRRRELLLPMAMPAAYATAFITSKTLDGYWLRPVFPFVTFFCAVFVLEVLAIPAVRGRLGSLLERLPRAAHPETALSVLAALLVLLLTTTPFGHNLPRALAALNPPPPDNRVAAAEWIRAHVPPDNPILLDGEIPHYHPRIPAHDPKVHLRNLGYPLAVGVRPLLGQGYARYYRGEVEPGVRWPVAVMDAAKYNFYLDRMHVPRGVYVVVNSYYEARFYTRSATQRSAKGAQRAADYYRRIRAQRKMAEFTTGPGPKIEIWRMTETWPPADVSYPSREDHAPPKTERPATPG